MKQQDRIGKFEIHKFSGRYVSYIYERTETHISLWSEPNEFGHCITFIEEIRFLKEYNRDSIRDWYLLKVEETLRHGNPNISPLEDSDEKVCRLEKVLQKVALSDILNGYFPLTSIKLLNRNRVKIEKWQDLEVKERWAKEEETYKVLQKLRKKNQL